MKNLVTYFFTFIFSIAANYTLAGDSTSNAYEKNYYRKSWSLGGMAHPKGLGVNFRREQFRSALVKSFWTIEAYNVKSAKEKKSYGSGGDQSSSFIYGKLNHLYILKGGIGRQKIIFDKEVIRGVQISTIYNINFALGFLKPIYLEVFIPDQNGAVSTERYNPDIHKLGQINEKAPWNIGAGEMLIVPGLSGKIALNFEFAPKSNKIKAIETGVNIDAFMKPMPIMANQSNQYVFVNLYLNFQFGRKSYL